MSCFALTCPRTLHFLEFVSCSRQKELSFHSHLILLPPLALSPTAPLPLWRSGGAASLNQSRCTKHVSPDHYLHHLEIRARVAAYEVDHTLNHAHYAVFINNLCGLKLILTSRTLNLSGELKEYLRHDREECRLRGEEKRKHTMHRLPQQLQPSFEIPIIL